MPKHPFICAIVSDNSAAEQIELCQHSISSPVRIITTESSKCIVATKRVIEEGAAVIVSRGSVWSTIKKAFPLVPTLQTPITCCDAIEFLTKAKQYDTNIGVVSFPSHIAKMVTVAPHLGVSLTVHQVNNPDDIEKGCYEMRDKGMKVLVGGGHAVQWAQKLGLHGVLHTVSADGVIQVLNEADRILNAIISERSKDARVRTMLNALKDGAISLNEQGKILEYNLPAQKMFANGESTMKSIRTFLQDTGIIEAVQQQLTWSGESKKYEKKQYLCNIIPAYSNDIYCGASVIIQDASHIQSLEHKMRRELHAKGHVARYTLKDVVGHSAEMRSLVEHAELYANSPSSIFIYGESGTGKEIFAQGIHMASPFRNGPFVGINCTALPESLLESELFGYAEGAFTGAKKGGKVGLFEMAHNGTLFLDEIGEIPTSVQAKLLRVLEEKIVMRIGQERYIPINVRIVCATNKDLAELVRCGKFREDLFYRLNVLRLNLPPLRKHPEDIEELADSFLSWLPQSLSLPRPQISRGSGRAEALSFPGQYQGIAQRHRKAGGDRKGQGNTGKRHLARAPDERGPVREQPQEGRDRAPVAFRTCRCEQTNQAEYASCPDKQHHPSGTGGNTGQQGGNSPASGHLPRHVMEEAEGDRRTREEIRRGTSSKLRFWHVIRIQSVLFLQIGRLFHE